MKNSLNILAITAIVISLGAIGVVTASQFNNNKASNLSNSSNSTPDQTNPNPQTLTPSGISNSKPDQPDPNPQPPTTGAANQLANARQEATSSGNLEKAIQIAQGIPNSSPVYSEAQQQIQNWKSDLEKYNNVLANIRQAYSAGQWQVVVDLAYSQIPRNQYWDSNSELTTMAVNAKQKLQPSKPSSSSSSRNSGIIRQGQVLNRGESIDSPSGTYRLILQNDGNLVLYPLPSGSPVWGSGTEGKAVEKAVMQEDGNFVLYSYDGKPVWGSGTEGTNAIGAVVTDGGSLRIIMTGSEVIKKFP